jgi:hypothetical protein
MTNGIKTVVTSVYELNYETLRGGGVYKNFELLTETIRALIFDEYNYVIYTDKKTYDKHNLSEVFKHPNVKIKFQELNSEFYTTKINPIREDKFSKGEIYDRIYSVSNYMEVILNKLKHIVDESNLSNDEDSVIWLDSGLFGTSCHNSWRDYIKTIVYDKFFLDKIFEKIDENGFIATKGKEILINYEVKDRVSLMAGSDISIIPGCLFGGKVSNNLEILSNYENIFLEYITKYSELISEQEVLSILTTNKEIKFFEFGDWLDLQKAFLQILDLYDESIYLIDSCYKKDEDPTVISSNYNTEDSDSIISYPLSDREILEKIINVSNYKLDNLDLTHNNYMLDNMNSFAQYYHYPSGREHYRFLSFISKLYNNEVLCDIGTNNGCSAISLSEEPTNIVKTFDVVDYKEPGFITKPNIEFNLKNVLDDDSILTNTRFIMLDTNHDGVFENQFYSKLKELNYKGILFLDDIHLNPEMVLFWSTISEEKYDLTSKGHNTGTGIVIFE